MSTLGIAPNDIVDDLGAGNGGGVMHALRCDADFHYYRRPANGAGMLIRCMCDKTPWPQDHIPRFVPTLGVWASPRAEAERSVPTEPRDDAASKQPHHPGRAAAKIVVRCNDCGWAVSRIQYDGPACRCCGGELVPVPTEAQGYVAPSGAKRSEEAPYYHLVPPHAARREAVRWTLGAKTKGDWNWWQGVRDPQFIQQILNHLVEHLLKFQAELNETDDHLAAIKWGCSALMEIERVAPDALRAALLPPPMPDAPGDR